MTTTNILYINGSYHPFLYFLIRPLIHLFAHVYTCFCYVIQGDKVCNSGNFGLQGASIAQNVKKTEKSYNLFVKQICFSLLFGMVFYDLRLQSFYSGIFDLLGYSAAQHVIKQTHSMFLNFYDFAFLYFYGQFFVEDNKYF